MVSPVTVYSTPTCPWCDRVKEYLTRNGVQFDNKDVSQDYPAAMEMIQKSGQQGVPVTVADDDVIVGFDQGRLARIVDKFGPPKREPLGLLAADAEQYLSRHPDIAADFPPGTKGVFVGEIRPGSVAEKSGIRHRDVITAVAGKRVRDMRMLDQIVDTLRAGESVSVRYNRGSSEATTTFQF